MKHETPPLIAEPADVTPETGPRRRPGLLGLLTALFGGLVLFGLGMALLHADQIPLGAACLSLFALSLLAALACLLRRTRLKHDAPRTHAVLTDYLGFRIDFTCNDVATTAFVEPDTLAAGEGTRLLCFLENLASRSRVTHLQIGPSPLLGLDAPHRVSLALSAGQAAVYVLPLSTTLSPPPGEHDLPIAIKISKPTGDGLLLPGAKRHLHNLWTVHYATPYSVEDRQPARSGPRQTGQAVYLSLASVSAPTPRLEALEQLLRH